MHLLALVHCGGGLPPFHRHFDTQHWPAASTPDALHDCAHRGTLLQGANWPGHGASCGGGCDPPSGGRHVPLIRKRWMVLQLGPSPVRRIYMSAREHVNAMPKQPFSTTLHVKMSSDEPMAAAMASTWTAGSSALLSSWRQHCDSPCCRHAMPLTTRRVALCQ